MKYTKIQIFSLLIFIINLLSNQVYSQSKLLLSGSAWDGTHSPLKKGNQLFFQGDTLVIIDLEGIRPPDQYRFVQKSDTIILHMIDDLSFTCRSEQPALYRTFWSNNGEKLYFKPIEDPCLDRFTMLVSESPWYKIREDGSLRADWIFLNPEKDSFAGIGLYEAYRSLRFKRSKPIIVAVIDTPLDYTHEDLKNQIWINPLEIPDNQEDDDKNNFKDDTRGWFFNCSRSGELVRNEQNEATQIVAMWQSRFGTLDAEKALQPTDKQSYIIYQRALKKHEAGLLISKRCSLALSDSIQFIKTIEKMKLMASEPMDQEQIFQMELGKGDFFDGIKSLMADIFQTEGPNSFSVLVSNPRTLYSALKKIKSYDWEYSYNLDWNPRAMIGDHPEIPYEKMYGSGFLKNPSQSVNSHGTMVAGIIAGKRGNGIGMEGIADNVQLIALGAVPENGDERDKDVANSIRYAVDQGAKIINMSFAKRFSPHQSTVEEALRYAERKNVLIVRAAGNNGWNTDTVDFFPSPKYTNGQKAKNWLIVGNSNFQQSSQLVSPTSNYGSKSVDIFAPGTEIFSTSPGNLYESASGTSLSAPVVAGVAALIWSYFPTLTLEELKKVLLESSYKPTIEVKKPGDSGFAPFRSLSISGGIVNAKAAVILAEKIIKKKKA